jgi:CRP/FNR family cyclic AMP-dependent transcriptional regulator
MSYNKDHSSRDRSLEGQGPDSKLDISLLKFFWQINPFFKSETDVIPKFLRNVEVLKNLSDLEIWELTKVLHIRTYEKGELIFRENDSGVGFYFIMDGSVDIVIEKDHSTSVIDGTNEVESRVVVNLERGDYFGELAMLQDKHSRNASARAKEECKLLGIFKPDLDTMIHERPVVAAKLLQSVSLIVANRLSAVTLEVRKLKEKIATFEDEIGSDGE